MNPSEDPNSGLNHRVLWHRYYKYPYLLARFGLYAAIFFGLLVTLRSIESVAFPLFLSLLIAYLLDPVIDWFEERKFDRTVAISIVILCLLMAAGVFVAFLYPLVSKQVAAVIDRGPMLLDSLQTQWLPWLQQRFSFEVPPTLSEAFSRYSEEIKAAAPSVLKNIAGVGSGLLSSTGGLLLSALNAVMIPIFTFYFLRDFDLMKERASHYIPKHRTDFIYSRLAMVDDVVGAWFRGQVQVALILAGLYGVGLAISFWATGHSAFDGLALGLITGIINIIPYVGFAVGAVLSVLVVLIEWTGWGSLIGLVLVFGIVQGLEGYVITPKIVGEKVGLSPVMVIIVLLLGGELGGLLGILLSIPLAGALKVVWPDLAEYYKSTSYFRGVEVVPLEPDPVVAVPHDGPTEDLDEIEAEVLVAMGSWAKPRSEPAPEEPPAPEPEPEEEPEQEAEEPQPPASADDDSM